MKIIFVYFMKNHLLNLLNHLKNLKLKFLSIALALPVIQGHEKKGVLSAKTRIEVLVDSARQRLPFTHFLSIPVQGEDVVEKFEDFKFQVIEDKRVCTYLLMSACVVGG